MARDAIGSDWAKYHKAKSAKRQRAIDIKKTKPALYLLKKVDAKYKWFGEPLVLVKVGKTKRNALIRHSEQALDGYEMVQYWELEKGNLNFIEREVIKEFKKEFGNPIKGNECFQVKNASAPLKIIEKILEKK